MGDSFPGEYLNVHFVDGKLYALNNVGNDWALH